MFLVTAAPVPLWFETGPPFDDLQHVSGRVAPYSVMVEHFAQGKQQRIEDLENTARFFTVVLTLLCAYAFPK
jgi:hypothetical protein